MSLTVFLSPGTLLALLPATLSTDMSDFASQVLTALAGDFSVSKSI